MELGISGSKVRALCEAGLIASETTPSGHFRIELSEIERLKRDGVPPVPRPELPSGNVAEQHAERPLRALRQAANGESVAIAEHGDRSVESATDLVVMRHQVEKLALEIQLSEGKDKLAARARRQAMEREQEERNRRAGEEEAQAITKKGQWKAFWIDYTVKSVPTGAPKELLLAIAAQLETIFAASDFRQPGYSTQTLVDAAVEVELRPWRKSQDINRVVERAIERLPSLSRSAWKDTPVQSHARQAVRAAVHEIEQSALPEIERVVFAVVDGITAQIEHRERCQPITNNIRRDLYFAATPDEFTAATEALRAAFETTVPGVDDKELQRVKDNVLLPFRTAIKAREEQQTRKRERAEREARILSPASFRMPPIGDTGTISAIFAAVRTALSALPVEASIEALVKARDEAAAPILRAHQSRRLITIAFGELGPYLRKLAAEFEIDENLLTLERELRPKVEADLINKLQGNEPAEVVAKLMRRAVREKLDISVAA